MGIATSTPSATTGAEGTIKLAGDLGGTSSAPTVTGITGAVVNVADLANGTDGELITWDASGVATTVAVGTAGQVLTSNGAGAAPTFQTAAGGSFSWGSTATDTSGVGLTLTVANSSAASTKGLSVVIGNTQTNTCQGISISTGSSTVAHTALSITASAASTTQVGILVALATGTGGGISITGGDNNKAYYVKVTDTSAGYNTKCFWVNYADGSPQMFLAEEGSSTGASRTGIGFDGLFYSHNSQALRLLTSVNDSSTTARSNAFVDIQSSQNYQAASGTRTDTGNIVYINRSVRCQTAGGTYVASAAVVQIKNTLVTSSGTMTDAAPVLYLNQSSSGNTGTPLTIDQTAVVSTNFKRILSLAGVTVWKSDGTTPNGALSGTAGDICLNGASSQAFYCTGTTNWTGM